ncbi:hypothetical protein [Rhodanobacter sp. BL-MT-08]
MPVAVSSDVSTRTRGPMLWRVEVWILLLVSAFGSLQYIKHMQNVWGQLRDNPSLQPADLDALHGMLGWDAAYLLVAFVLIVICAGCIMRQAWARPCMRVAAVLLAVWLLITGYLQLRDLQALGANSAAILAQAQQQGTAGAAQMLVRLQRGYQLALVFKAVGLIALLWLAKKLGQPLVRMQFRSRR